MKLAKLEELDENLSQFILESLKESLLVTYEGQPRAIVIGLNSEEDDLEELFLIEERRFLKIVERARQDFQDGKWVELQSLPD
ncbi:MAG: hypothetical protein SW833_20150 [Cyanobacteriota bacterium]|nr:hypothetical protein [Cyanobacteriota bacterium]